MHNASACQCFFVLQICLRHSVFLWPPPKELLLETLFSHQVDSNPETFSSVYVKLLDISNTKMSLAISIVILSSASCNESCSSVQYSSI